MRARSEWCFEEIDSCQATICFPARENPGSALLYGEPGCGKSTLALKFACQTQGAFDAVVFQLCGQLSVAEMAAELARKLKLGFENIAAIKAWLADRRLC
jgi:KaiC/GvpD/RAD55 family RecA-like ATPase